MKQLGVVLGVLGAIAAYAAIIAIGAFMLGYFATMGMEAYYDDVVVEQPSAETYEIPDYSQPANLEYKA